MTDTQNTGLNVALGAIGSGLSAYGQHAEAQGLQQFLQRRDLLRLFQGANWQDRVNEFLRTTDAAQADPLGASQGFAQHNALLSAILPRLGPAHSVPGDPAVAAQSAPAPSWTPMSADAVDSLYGPQATMRSLANRDMERAGINPMGATATDLTSMYGAAASPYMSEVQRYVAARQEAARQARAQRDSAFSTALAGA